MRADPGRRLMVVNADDLGLHEDINRGIRRAHQEGIVTSASLVPCGRAFEDALNVLRACPDLGVGVHLTLIEEGPLCRPERIPSLLNQDGQFYGSYRRFSERVLLGKVKLGELRHELEAQVRRALEAGIRPSHLDSHQHVHVLPQVWQVVTEIAGRYRIPFIRIPYFQSVWRRLRAPWEGVFRAGLNAFSRTRRRQLDTFRAADFMAGLHVSGRLKESDLLDVLRALRPGICEVIVHPGVTTPALEGRYAWGFEWSGELSALTSAEVRAAVERAGVCLVNYRRLAASNARE